MRTRLGRVLFAGIAAALLVSPVVSAVSHEGPSQDESTRGAGSLPETPEARLELWTHSLRTFLESHPDLSAPQREALQKALNNTSPDLFADNPEIQQKTRIATTLSEVKKSLYCAKYGEVFSGFKGLGAWLQENDIVGPDEGLTCNCGSGGCATGFVCLSLGCYAEKGSTNYGVCRPAPTPTPDPDPNPSPGN